MTRQKLAQQLRRIANDLESAVGEHVDKSLHEQADAGIAAQRFDREGGRSGDHSDPTFAQATRPQAIGAHRDHLQAWDRAIDAIGKHATILEKLIREHHPDPKLRPVSWKPCRRGNLHQPDVDPTAIDPEANLTCSASNCGRSWPCNDSETESWWQPCRGTIDPTTGLCTDCKQSGRSWVCRDCGEVFTDGIDGPSRNERCERDDKRVRRAALREDAA